MSAFFEYKDFFVYRKFAKATKDETLAKRSEHYNRALDFITDSHTSTPKRWRAVWLELHRSYPNISMTERLAKFAGAYAK